MVYRDNLRDVYREAVYREVDREVDRDSPEAAYHVCPRSQPEGHRHYTLNYITEKHLLALPITGDYGDIQQSMQKQSTRALESASALTYRVSMTTYWEADKIDIYVMYDWRSPTAINNAGSGISNQCRVKSRSSHRYRVTSGSSTINYGSRFKVRFKVVSFE